jgi:hypothetical protein
MRFAGAFVIDETVVVRTSRRDESAGRERRKNAGIEILECGSRFGDVEALTTEQRLQLAAHAEREPSDGRDDLKPFVLHVVP